MRLNKRTLILSLLIFTSLLFAVHTKAKTIYKIGVVNNEAPYSYLEDNLRKGIEIEILERVSEIEGFEYSLYPMEFSKILNAVQTEELEGAIGRVGITDERKKAFQFSKSYYSSALMYAVPQKKSSEIASLQETKGKKIGVRKGSNAEIIAYESQVQYQWALVHAATTENLFQDLSEGKTDFVLGDTVAIELYNQKHTKSNEKIKFLSKFQKKISYGFVVKKERNKELLEKINHGLGEIQKNGELDKIIHKYTKGIHIPKDETPERQTYKVGYSTDLSALIKKQESGKLVGFDVEFLDMISEIEKINFIYIHGNYNQLFSMLQHNAIDLIAIEALLTPKRQKDYDFSTPYLDAGFGYIVPLNSTIVNIRELRGKEVGVITQSAMQSWAEENQEKYGYTIREYSTTTEELIDFHNGKIDSIVLTSDSYYNKEFNEKLKGKLLNEFQNFTDIGFLFKKGTNSELREKINHAILQLKSNGTYDKLLEKYDVLNVEDKEEKTIPNTEKKLQDKKNENIRFEIILGIALGCILIGGSVLLFSIRKTKGDGK